MTESAIPPARRRAGWFANRPIAVKILATIAFSASVGVLLCVVAFSDLDKIENTFEAVRQGYTAYFTF
jgi:methyl-accepting chemotaxis protein